MPSRLQTGLCSLFMLLAHSAVAADCPAPVPSAQVEQAIASSERFFQAFESDAFDSTMDQLALDLTCLSDPITPSLAADLHIVQGLRLFTSSKKDLTANTFAAARAAGAKPTLAESLPRLSPGHVLHDLYVRQSVDDTEWEKVRPPNKGALTFDGRRDYQRPTEWPTLVQITDSDGAVLETAYVVPGGLLPNYVPKPPRGKRAMFIASGGAAVISGALYASALRSKSVFKNAEYNTVQKFSNKRSQTNFMVLSSIGAGTLAATGFGVALAMR